jgi:hypothetical protein
MTDKETLKLALDALESCITGHIADGGIQWHNEKLVEKAITALKERLADPMREVQRLGQEIEPDDMASILACRDMLDAQPVPPRKWVGLTDEDMYVVSEEESCSFIAGAKWSEEILKGKNT